MLLNKYHIKSDYMLSLSDTHAPGHGPNVLTKLPKAQSPKPKVRPNEQ